MRASTVRTTLLHTIAGPASAIALLAIIGVAACSSGHRRPAADHSLSTQQYIRLGIPAPDHSWGGAELAAAAAAISALAAEDPARLPRSGSQRSGTIFARLSGAGATILLDSSTPASQRVAEFVSCAQARSALITVYSEAPVIEAIGTRDLIELIGATLHASAAGIELADEMAASSGPGDQGSRERAAGLERMKTSLAATVTASLTLLTESAQFPTPDRERLAAFLGQTLPSILPRLPEETRIGIITQVEELARDPSLADLRRPLARLRDRVREPGELRPTPTFRPAEATQTAADSLEPSPLSR